MNCKCPIFPVSGFLFFALSGPAFSQDSDWIVLIGPGKEMDAWKAPAGKWEVAGDAALDPANPRRLTAKPGQGVIVQGDRKSGGRNLFSKQSFGDIELHMEFILPKGSNSGVKFHGHYEIQIEDSFGKKELTGSDCGGIYPRAILNPGYTHIDKGIAPLTNACKPHGEWQTLDAIFLAPRFNEKGEKTANARLTKVLLNGALIHDNIELKTPTGDRWKNKEFTSGPLFLQADHGGVAFRNMKVRELNKGK